GAAGFHGLETPVDRRLENAGSARADALAKRSEGGVGRPRVQEYAGAAGGRARFAWRLRPATCGDTREYPPAGAPSRTPREPSDLRPARANARGSSRAV